MTYWSGLVLWLHIVVVQIGTGISEGFESYRYRRFYIILLCLASTVYDQWYLSIQTRNVDVSTKCQLHRAILVRTIGVIINSFGHFCLVRECWKLKCRNHNDWSTPEYAQY